MVKVMSPFEASPRKNIVFENMNFWTTRYLQPSPNDPPGPQSFLQEQGPGAILRAHFHRANQFQVVVKGQGKLGKHAVSPLSLHYSDGDTPYGPLVAGEEGLGYFTLRAKHEDGAYFMPESRKEREKAGKKRSLMPEHIELSTIEFSDNDTLKSKTIIEKHEDGLFAHLITVPPNKGWDGPSPKNGDGQFYLIVKGSMRYDEKELPLWSTIFVFPEDEPLKLEAGDNGLAMLVMQFPRT